MTDKHYYWATITKPQLGFGVVVEDNIVTEIGEPMVQYLEGWWWNRARFHLRRRGLRYVEVPRHEIEIQLTQKEELHD